MRDVERLLSLAVVVVLGAGTASAVGLEDRPVVRRAPVAVSTPSPSPQPTPTATTPAPAPQQAAPAKATPAGPIPAPPEPPQAGCPVPRRPGGWGPPKPLPAPAVADADLPAPLPPGPKASSLAPVSGKGLWVTNWPTTELDIPALVAKARAGGIRSLWVRTGGTRQGWYGDRFLPELIPAAHAAGLEVVAWDFPFLSDPVADAARAKQALDAGVDAFAPDIETQYEGTHSTPRRVELYLSLVRHHAGDRPVAATVPRPTPNRLASFPYASFPAYADLFVPMVYWSCHEPGALVQESLDRLGRWLPVAPVGQAYDMGDEGGRRGVPTREETWRFLDVAKRGGAVGASLWTVERMGPGQYDALVAYPWE